MTMPGIFCIPGVIGSRSVPGGGLKGMVIPTPGYPGMVARPELEEAYRLRMGDGRRGW